MTKEWERWRETILGLYKGEARTLAETMDIMETRHGFKASTRAYRSRLKRWGEGKYNIVSRRQSAPNGPANSQQTMTGSVGMSQSSSDPGLRLRTAGPSRSRSSTSSSHNQTPYSPDYQAKSDWCASSPDSISSALSPHAPVDQSYAYYTAVPPPPPPPHHHHQQQQHAYDARVHSLLENPQTTDFHFQNHSYSMPLQSAFRPTEPPPPQQTPSFNPVDACVRAILGLLSPRSLPSTRTEADDRVQRVAGSIRRLAELGRLDDRFLFGGDVAGPTAFELCVRTFVSSPGFLFARDVRPFCRLCATFVRHGADAGELVPGSLGKAHYGSGGLGDDSNSNSNSGNIPRWISTWIWACVQSWRGNRVTAERFVSMLPVSNTQDLVALLPEMYRPISPESQASHSVHDAWGQQ